MNITDFRNLTSHLSDAEFLESREVREVYWKCMGWDKFMHTWTRIYTHSDGWIYHCEKCHAAYVDCTHHTFECEKPDPIPGSLADAVEQMRVKVAKRWEEADVRLRFDIACVNLHRGITSTRDDYINDNLRDRFMIYAVSCGVVEAK